MLQIHKCGRCRSTSLYITGGCASQIKGKIFTDLKIFFTVTLSNEPFLIWLLTTPPYFKYAATLPCNSLLMACFADINVSHGSVATHARCGGIFNMHLTANLPRNLQLKNFVRICRYLKLHIPVHRRLLQEEDRRHPVSDFGPGAATGHQPSVVVTVVVPAIHRGGSAPHHNDVTD